MGWEEWFDGEGAVVDVAFADGWMGIFALEGGLWTVFTDKFPSGEIGSVPWWRGARTSQGEPGVRRQGAVQAA